MSSTRLNRLIGTLRDAIESRHWETLSDQVLLESFLSTNDPAAFEAIVRRHAGEVLSACRRVLPQPADVDDVFQATFLVLMRQAKSIRKQQSLGSWLFGVAHRLALQARTRSARRTHVESKQASSTQDDSPDLSWREACLILHEELDRLPDGYRMPLLLCYLEGKSRDEAAQHLGCTVGALHGRLERGRERLRNRLLKRGVTLSAGLLAAVANSVIAGDVSPVLVQSTLSIAYSAARTPVNVAALVHGVTPMFVHKAKWLVTAALVAVGMAAIGIGISLSEEKPKADPTAQAEKPFQQPEAKSASAENTAAVTEVSGRVLGPDGKPAAGAKLFVLQLKNKPPISESDITTKQIGTVGADGSFHLKIPVIQEIPRGYLYASADKAGAGVFQYDLEKAKFEDVTLKLARDQPITGRIVDTQGKPVSGANVSIDFIAVPVDEKLDAYLETWKKHWEDADSQSKVRLPGSFNGKGTVTTDKDGRFRLNGAGAERIAQITVQGGGVSKTVVHVITREKFDPKPYDEAARAQAPPGRRGFQPQLYGPDFNMVVALGKAAEGVVKDLATGKPLAGVSVYSFVASSATVRTTTDANGRYRLEGLSTEKTKRIYASPAKDSSYLRRGVTVMETPGTEPLHVDIGLAKGVVVSGRVIDRETGKGLRAGIRFAPLRENMNADKPGFDGYKSDHTMELADKDGRFRITTIPGKSLMMVQVEHDGKINGLEVSPFMNAQPDPDYKDLFTNDSDRDSWYFTAHGGSTEFLSSQNYVKVVDLKENSDEVKVELFVERGQTAKIAIQDADGKPLKGVIASGLTACWPIAHKLNNATATVYALDPAKPRQMVFMHPEKRLGSTAMIRGDEKEPVVVKLAPLGSVTGRFVDIDGGPIGGADVSVSVPDHIGRELYRLANLTEKPTKTDSAGRFTLTGIVPNSKFYIGTRKDKTFYVGEPTIGLLEVEPGKTLDLGERKMKSAN